MFLRKISFAAALCGVLSLVSCPLNMPEQVRVRASPSMYMPIGSPGVLKDQLDKLTADGGLGKLASLEIKSTGTNTGTYEYQGPEYGDTRVIMVVMKDLANQDFSTIAGGLDAAIASGSSLSFPYNVSGFTIPQGTSDDIDLSGLFDSTDGVLKDYPGLEFRSVPAYLYITGPAKVLKSSDVTLEFTDGTNPLSSGGYTGKVYPMALPNLPAAPGPVMSTLPKSSMILQLKSIFNESPQPDTIKAQLDFTVENGGPISIDTLDELRAFAVDLQTPLTAHLVLLIPFQFTVNKTMAPNGIPVFAGPDDPSNTLPNPAMELVENGGDLLGRDGDGSMDDIVENLESLIMEASVVNNLGINGYIKMLPAMPPSYNPNADELGRISLSGKSAVTIPKAKLETPPFSPVLEIYLEGDFDIKRSLPPEGAMTMNLGIVLRTGIDKTF